MQSINKDQEKAKARTIISSQTIKYGNLIPGLKLKTSPAAQPNHQASRGNGWQCSQYD
jgi:hypothetical protein